MREVFEPKDKPDPGSVFYTIRREDIGKRVIETEIGPIRVMDFLGSVLPQDIGRRLFRVRSAMNDYWYWQAESDRKRNERVSREAMATDLQKELLDAFWEVYDARDDRQGNSLPLPGAGVEAEVRTADGPPEKGKGPRLRGTGKRRPQRG